MTEETKKKLQQFHAEQLAKATGKAKPQDRTGKPTPQQPATIEKAIVENKNQTPELSTVTFSDLLPDAKPADQTLFPFRRPTNFSAFNIPIVKYQEQTTTIVGTKNETQIEIIEYSEKSFALVGEGTKKIKDQLPRLGGSYNRFLKCGAGWIFSNKRKAEVITFLERMTA